MRDRSPRCAGRKRRGRCRGDLALGLYPGRDVSWRLPSTRHCWSNSAAEEPNRQALPQNPVIRQQRWRRVETDGLADVDFNGSTQGIEGEIMDTVGKRIGQVVADL